MSGNSGLSTLFLVLLVVGIAIAVFFIVRRQAYLRSLREQGWTFENSPTLADTYGLNSPPFGLGFDRSIDDLISGTTHTGVPFRVFEYAGVTGYLAVFDLPWVLPEAFVSAPGAGRPGVAGMAQDYGSWQVVAQDPAFAAALMNTVGHLLDGVAVTQPVNLSIDGRALVALGAPHDAEPLAAFLDNLGSIAQAIAASDLGRFAGGTVPSELSVYGHPDWIYRPADDRFLAEVEHETGGDSHEARHVLLADLPGGLRMIALHHHWTTTRTVTETDSEGHTHTRTVTDHHDEPIQEFHLPWAFGDLSVNVPWTGERVRFESSDFNAAYQVRSDYPKFAMDVFHPRQMEFMLRAAPFPFATRNGRLVVKLDRYEQDAITGMAAFAVAFFAGVPNFVWEDLGLREPPVDPQLAGF